VSSPPNSVTPVVRTLIACEEIITDPNNSNRVTLVNLVSSIRSMEDPAYPLQQPVLCVFAQLTDCRGQGEVRIEIREADTEEVVLTT